MDAGWLWSVENCVVSTNTIFSSVLVALLINPERKYTVGDLYFFETWYKN